MVSKFQEKSASVTSPATVLIPAGTDTLYMVFGESPLSGTNVTVVVPSQRQRPAIVGVIVTGQSASGVLAASPCTCVSGTIGRSKTIVMFVFGGISLEFSNGKRLATVGAPVTTNVNVRSSPNSVPSVACALRSTRKT